MQITLPESKINLIEVNLQTGGWLTRTNRNVRRTHAALRIPPRTPFSRLWDLIYEPRSKSPLELSANFLADQPKMFFAFLFLNWKYFSLIWTFVVFFLSPLFFISLVQSPKGDYQSFFGNVYSVFNRIFTDRKSKTLR